MVVFGYGSLRVVGGGTGTREGKAREGEGHVVGLPRCHWLPTRSFVVGSVLTGFEAVKRASFRDALFLLFCASFHYMTF
jgi:hypothetical protein